MSNERPLVSVYSAKESGKAVKQVSLPDVFTAPVRQDMVQRIYHLTRMNKRQPYAVNRYAGMQTAAESWGTGRAVSRIPRVPGGGTHRAGQGAFGNMCRGGRMFSPTKVWRRWMHTINTQQRRMAIASGISASAEPAIVEAHGHVIDNVHEFPMVVSNDLESLKKTKEVKEVLKLLGLKDELVKVNKTRHIRAGRGKSRGRKYKQKKGPLIVYKKNLGIRMSARGIRGVDTVNVKNLSLLQLAPGARVGRLVIWTEDAFAELNNIWGTYGNKSVQSKLQRTGGVNGRKFKLPREVLTNSDINSIIHSDEVRNVVRDHRLQMVVPKYANPLKHRKAMERLNPFYATLRQMREAKNKSKK